MDAISAPQHRVKMMQTICFKPIHLDSVSYQALSETRHGSRETALVGF